jgi:hypothetical protein
VDGRVDEDPSTLAAYLVTYGFVAEASALVAAHPEYELDYKNGS